MWLAKRCERDRCCRSSCGHSLHRQLKAGAGAPEISAQLHCAGEWGKTQVQADVSIALLPPRQALNIGSFRNCSKLPSVTIVRSRMLPVGSDAEARQFDMSVPDKMQNNRRLAYTQYKCSMVQRSKLLCMYYYLYKSHMGTRTSNFDADDQAQLLLLDNGSTGYEGCTQPMLDCALDCLNGVKFLHRGYYLLDTMLYMNGGPGGPNSCSP